MEMDKQAASYSRDYLSGLTNPVAQQLRGSATLSGAHSMGAMLDVDALASFVSKAKAE